MSDALLSACGTYRYTLGRNLIDVPSRMTARQIETIVGDDPEVEATPESIQRSHKPCLFVMLNPSTADASLDDPTIRRCKGFAQREGCTFLTVVNLFALRSTDPDELARHPEPVGVENVTHISRELRRHNPSLGHLVIAAWGAHPMARHFGVTAIRDRLREEGALCLGMTKDGEPRHPLYLRADAALIPWTRRP